MEEEEEGAKSKNEHCYHADKQVRYKTLARKPNRGWMDGWKSLMLSKRQANIADDVCIQRQCE